MGLMTGSGCLSRVMGPVFVTYIYTEFGTIWTFGITTVMMIVSMLWLYLFYHRLMPTEQIGDDIEEAGTKLQEENKFDTISLHST